MDKKCPREVTKKVSARSHQKCPRGFTLRKCPLEFAHFEKKGPQEVIVHEKSPSPYKRQGRNQYGKAGKATSIPKFSDTFPYLNQGVGADCTNLLTLSHLKISEITPLNVIPRR